MNPRSTKTTDRHLLELINQKDESVFTILYQQFWSPLLSFAGNYLSDTDTCKEVVQELFITLHTKRFQLKVSSSVSSYLYSSLKNKIFNHLRDQSVYNKHIKGASRTKWASFNDNNVEQTIDLIELNRSINECLLLMPEKYRQVYTLHKQYGYTLKKTSFLLKRPVDTVEKQYRRIIHLIREHLCEKELYPAISLNKA
ncbi:sigma-70 family RNA polymerase sigma factor [Paraflavitalea sp. CAU 1676]|uniref:RNA polymerase sigma factor n=1 Tax=Paraflavitalea sp. CAU 1676 TaxID=3032598 RepID=UPI0023D9BA5E|nr:sigma-70 family RNA polymerase sigma factor [Paraflavitalea sp. CAU 1676]MDF2191576.1 sigma-70 family RNA polymerase sigma factor [Paraflavitalea sp. CAU 1676]